MLRRAAPGDAALLAALAARLFGDTYAPPHGGSRAADVAAYVRAHFAPAIQRAELEDAALETVLAEVDGAVVGFAQLRWGSRPESASDLAWLPGAAGGEPEVRSDGDGSGWAELARLYVDRRYHGRRVGAALVERVCAVAAGGGARRLWLSAYQGNAQAVAFYRRAGFQPVATASFQMGAERQADWIMARALPQALPGVAEGTGVE